MYDILNVYLENGLRVVLHKVPNTKTMAVGMWIKQGSKYETDQSNGFSHLVEHLMVNKSKINHLPVSGMVKELTNRGVMFNAATTKDYTYYYFSGLASTLDMSLKALAQLMAENREITEEMLETEKKVVISETKNFLGSLNQIKERTSQALYGNIGVGRSILGSISNIENASIEELNLIISSRYVPENSSLVIVGDIDYDEVLAVVEENFLGWKDTETMKQVENIEDQPGIYFSPIAGRSDASVISLGFRVGGFNCIERSNIEVLTALIGGGGLESRLAEEIRVKRGLAYTLGAFTNFYEERGVVGLTVVCSNESIFEVAKIMANIICSIKERGVEEQEIDRAKNILTTQTVIDLGNIGAHLKFLGKVTAYNSILSIEREIRDIKKVKKKYIEDTARKIFIEENLGVACIGNFDIDKLIEQISI